MVSKMVIFVIGEGENFRGGGGQTSDHFIPPYMRVDAMRWE